MVTLIALAISVAFAFSVVVTLGYRGMPLWEELATLVTIMLLGHWIEMRSISQAQGALKELAELLPNTAVRIIGDRTEEVAIDQLREQDVVFVRPGAGIPRGLHRSDPAHQRGDDSEDVHNAHAYEQVLLDRAVGARGDRARLDDLAEVVGHERCRYFPTAK